MLKPVQNNSHVSDYLPDNARLSWHLYFRPSDAWEAMYRDCLAARKSIEFEQYIIEDDPVGRRFMELFIEKAKAGLKVFLICDTFGSMGLYNSPLVKNLRRHGGHVHFYNPFGRTLFTPWRWFPRTHTKTLLIDSAIAYTGGVCMADRMRSWRDTHMRVTGPIITQIRQAFDDIENRILRKKSAGIHKISSDRSFLYFLNRPVQNRLAVYNALIRAIKEAKEYIYISSAYFIPNRRFISYLKHARDRGVDVRVIVPARSDVRLIDWICLSYTPRFLKAGLRIYHYHETVMHSKTAFIDDKWATIGSSNFDLLSFFYNREANIITTNKETVAELKKQFFDDLHWSSELTWERWRQVPLWKKIIGYAGRLLRAFFR